MTLSFWRKILLQVVISFIHASIHHDDSDNDGYDDDDNETPLPLPLTPPSLLSFEVPRLLGPLKLQQDSPLAHHAVATALNQLMFVLLWLPVTEHNFLNSSMYF
jgi:hypothetical protein